MLQTYVDPYHRLDVSLIYPPKVAVQRLALQACAAEGAHYVGTRGFETIAQQDARRAAWLRGEPGAGKAAPGGKSAHQYGLADDWCRDGSEAPGLQPDWTDPAYLPLGKHTRAVGLLWGVSFGDAPHCQWPGYVTGEQMAPLLELYRSRRWPDDAAFLAAVWRRLDAERATVAWRRANPKLTATLRQLGL